MQETKVDVKDQTKDYRRLIVKIISENKLYFSTGLVIFCLFIYVIVKEYAHNVININFNVPMATNTKPLTSQLKNKAIDYISPAVISPTNELIKADDKGQISAISSEKVTYTRNKYIVKKGDSLASIALAVYGDRDAWVTIAKANNLKSPDYIEVGMELVIPR